MLRVGLTGGIGSGKSTVAQRFRELGAVVIDADQVAREVVTEGSTGLAAVRRRFGAAVMAADGSLDRGALGEIVFADTQARKDLEAITHPLIRARTQELMALAGPQDIVVHEVPLLVELEMAAAYHLAVVVGADERVRIARLTSRRRLTVADARARIATQVSDQQRRQAADVWLDNNGDVESLLAQVDRLWHDRLLPFNDNLMKGSAGQVMDYPDSAEAVHGSGGPGQVAEVSTLEEAAARLIRRVSLALGERAVAIEYIGLTKARDVPSEGVIDLRVTVRTLADAEQPAFAEALADRGFPRAAPGFHVNADPGRPAHLHVHEQHPAE
jgi:dephospho-CoA kinase